MCTAAIPADLNIFSVIEIGDIGFDVKKRCAIQHVNAFDVKVVPFYAEQTNCRESNRVGSARVAGGKYSMFLVIQKRFDVQVISLWALDQVQQKYM